MRCKETVLSVSRDWGTGRHKEQKHCKVNRGGAPLKGKKKGGRGETEYR